MRAAAEEFCRVGYEAASVNRILVNAGLSKGGFYYYFDDKADLAVTVLMWFLKDILAIYDRLQIPDDPALYWETLTNFTRETIQALEGSPFANELMSRLGQALVNDSELAQRAIDVVTRPTSVLRRGQEIGAVRSDLPAELLMSLLQSTKLALSRAYLPKGKVLGHEELEQITRVQMDLVRRICVPAQEKP